MASLDKMRIPLGAYDLANAKVAHRQTYRVQANWKLAIENYLECYHCATSHRAYARLHTLKDLEEKSAPVVAKMLENSDAHVLDTANRLQTQLGFIEVRHDVGLACGFKRTI